ncbi:MAG: hypothetical protein ACO1G9_01550 [Bacteroidota bacterium]
MIYKSKNTASLHLVSIITLITLLSACKKDVYVGDSSDQFKDYYPVELGHWVEYETDSVIHLSDDDVNLVDTSIEAYHFFIREEIESVLIDGEGDTAYIVRRYKRTSDTLPWEFTALWTSKLTNNALERVEDNRRFIRLTFPFNSDRKWNGNAYNDLTEEEYSYEDIHTPSGFSGLSFDSTVTVNQNEFISNINRIIKNEIYGNHVGLLYKKIDSVGIAFTQNGVVILSGLEYEQTVTDYKQ